MPRGGYRKPAEGKRIGRPKRERTPGAVDKGMAAEVLALAEHADLSKARPEIKAWHALLWRRNTEGVITMDTFDVRKYLTDKRDGKAVQNINHIHDKPLDVNVNISMSELVRKVRERKQAYERSL